MILEILLLALINSLLIIGLSAASMIEWKANVPNRITKKNISKEFVDKEYSQILWQVRFYILKIFGFKWAKPLITCPTCMSSFHSTYFYWLIVLPYIEYSKWYSAPADIEYIKLCIAYIPYILMLAGLNTILSKYLN